MPRQERINNSVLSHRKGKGSTQEDLAEAVGVTRQTIISIEKGNYVPSVMLAIKIAHYFNVDVEEIFTYEVHE